MASMDLAVRVVPKITSVDAAAWDRLDHGPSPFLRHGFLAALEASGSIGKRSGWQPAYILVEADGVLLGAVAAFVKLHSYGEYIFDWAWAGAAERGGIAYYPKLVVAAPITPATGRRILLAPEADRARTTELLAAAVRAVADETGCSSIHWLFCDADEQAALAELGFLPRASFQFHWHNRGYPSWDGFLGALASRKRKQLRKERARVHAAIDGVRWVPGAALTTAQLDNVDRWYRSTTEEHGGHDYLRPGFFHRVAAALPDETWVAEVEVGGKAVAGALFFETPGGLYGRYWGSDVELDCLHFETAYYSGIERCIARGIPLFEAGAQGEHKLVRGFEASPTYSAHWLRHPGLHAAIDDFVARERGAVAQQMTELNAYGPYRQGDDPA
ncbi:MAG: GNAT family N-acetyltransferase [Myxococcales bacterium]|nr:GNAT family N-acetyltransferase [Myxococcales bacterium]